MTGSKPSLPRQNLLLVGRSIRLGEPGTDRASLVYCVQTPFTATRRPLLGVVVTANHFGTKYLHPTEAAPTPSSAEGANIYTFWVGAQAENRLTLLYAGFIKSY